MKKIIFVLILILTISGVLLGILLNTHSSKSAQKDRFVWQPVKEGEIHRQPVKEGADRNNPSTAADYFDSCLTADDNNVPLYPNTYGGCYMGKNKTFVIQVTSSDLSEYQFIQDEFPCVVFEQVKYSYNYLQNLIYEYRNTYDPDSETIYMTCVDIHLNRAVIGIDEESLSHKTNDPDSPIVFELGHYVQLC